MATHDQRLTTLEQQKRTTDENMTILLGIVSEQQIDIKRMLVVLEEHTATLHEHSTAIRALLAQMPEKE